MTSVRCVFYSACLLVLMALPASAIAGAPSLSGIENLPLACEDDLFATATPPSTGLAGAINYNFYGNCEILANPSASVTVTSTLDGGTSGFDFQLNANAYATTTYPNGATSTGGQGRAGWQQYIINVKPGSVAGTTDVWADINNWPTGPNTKNGANGSDLINTQVAGGYTNVNGKSQLTGVEFYLVTLVNPGGASTPTLPTGTMLTITLDTDPSTRNVTGATFNVQLPASASTMNVYSRYYNNQEIPLVGLPLDPSLCTGSSASPWPDQRFCPNGPSSLGTLTAADTGPVTDFQLDVISQSTGSIFPAGSGTISYTTSNVTLAPAVPSGDGSYNQWYHPSCATGVITGETSNVGYSTMPLCTVGTPVQKFESLSEAVADVASACGAWSSCMANTPTDICLASNPRPACPSTSEGVDEGPVCSPSPTKSCPVTTSSTDACTTSPTYLAAMKAWSAAETACLASASVAQQTAQACAPAAGNYQQQLATCTSVGCAAPSCPGIPQSP